MDEKTDQALAALEEASRKLEATQLLVADAFLRLGEPESLRGIQSGIRSCRSNLYSATHQLLVSAEKKD